MNRYQIDYSTRYYACTDYFEFMLPSYENILRIECPNANYYCDLIMKKIDPVEEDMQIFQQIYNILMENGVIYEEIIK